MGLMKRTTSKPALDPFRALLPFSIGLTVVGWMIARAVQEKGGWNALEGAMTLPGWPLALALMVLLILLRDVGYVLRLRWLSDDDLTWRQAIETTVLWEFASAITPGIVGGGAVAIWGLHRQGMTAGRSTAIVFSTALLDELFYILTVPPLLLFYGEATMPDGLGGGFGWSVFWTGWGLLVLFAAVVGFGLFLAPISTHGFLLRMAKWRWVSKWDARIEAYGDELLDSSKQMRELSSKRWAGAFVATAMSWSARFLTLVAVMGMFVDPLASLNALLIVTQELVMWVFMMVSPTPGSSGVAEFLLGEFFQPLFDQAVSPLAPVMTILLWRMATHFLYLLVGVLVVPGWLRRTGRGKAVRSAEL